MTLVLSFDPGKNNGSKKSGTGWCLQDENTVYDFGVTQDLIEFLFEDIMRILRQAQLTAGSLKAVVYEGYQIRKETVAQNVGIQLSAVENIGAIKLIAKIYHAEVVQFMPQQKPTQWKVTDKNPTKVPKAQSHWIDAYNHGRYYLVTRNLAPSALEIEMANNGEL